MKKLQFDKIICHSTIQCKDSLQVKSLSRSGSSLQPSSTNKTEITTFHMNALLLWFLFLGWTGGKLGAMKVVEVVTEDKQEAVTRWGHRE